MQRSRKVVSTSTISSADSASNKSPVSQLAITLDLDGLDAELVEEVCFESGAVSVVLTDQRDDAILEPAPGEVRLWPATRMQAIFMGSIDDTAAIDALCDHLCNLCSIDRARLTITAIEQKAWEREWLRDFHPLQFGRHLWICPTHAAVEAEGAVVVTLDPGLAFGTGTHPTTRLCLEFLDSLFTGQALLADQECLVDYGCGSGILAIAALRLGARTAYAHDIDPQALIASRDNALLNGVANALRCVASADELSSLVADRGGAQIVLANILSGPLCELAPRLTALLADEGVLVLAGLLDEQADEVIGAYSTLVPLSRWRTLEGWTCLVGRRRG
jgi:ribosomal protein L11 methyltransferase